MWVCIYGCWLPLKCPTTKTKTFESGTIKKKGVLTNETPSFFMQYCEMKTTKTNKMELIGCLLRRHNRSNGRKTILLTKILIYCNE